MTFVQLPRRAAVFSVLAVSMVAAAKAVEPSAIDFSRDVQPILANHYFVCHGPTESSRQSGLRLDVRLTATTKLDSGAVAILPGQPEASEMLQRIAARDADRRMPPAEHGPALTPLDIQTL